MVLVLYGSPGETHEMAFSGLSAPTYLEGTATTFGTMDNAIISNWSVT